MAVSSFPRDLIRGEVVRMWKKKLLQLLRILMEFVFNTPVAAFSLQYLCNRHSFAAIDEVVCLL